MKIGGHTDEEAIEKITTKIAEEFVSKLLEFNKIKMERDEYGNVIFDVKLEVIIPETPAGARAGTDASVSTPSEGEAPQKSD